MANQNKSTSSISPSIWWAFLVCLLIRLFYLVEFGDKFTAFGYEHGNGLQALALLQGRGLETHDEYYIQTDKIQAKRTPLLLQPKDYPPRPRDNMGYYHALDMPGYPWILAGVWWLFDSQTFWPIKIIQTILSAFLIFPLCDIGRKLFNQRTAEWCAWLYAFWLPNAYLAQMACKEAWEGLLIIPACWLLLRYFMRGEKLSLLMCMITFTLSVFMRTNLLLLPFALCILGMLIFSIRRCLTAFILAGLFLLVCLFPWVLRNKHWVDPHIGIKEGFYWALSWNFSNVDPVFKKEILKYEGMRQNSDGTPRKLSREPPEIPPLVKQTLKERPVLFFALAFKQMILGPWQNLEWGYEILFPKVPSYTAFHSITGESRAYYLLKHPYAVSCKIIMRIFEITVVALSLATFWFWRDRWQICLWISICYWLFLFTYAFIHIESRYIVPHTWALIILAASCLECILKKCRSLRATQKLIPFTQTHLPIKSV